MKNKFLDILIRYLILVLIALPGFGLFYFAFSLATIYPVYFLLNLFFKVSLTGTTIMIASCFPIEIIGACVGGGAYFLLLFLNLSLPEIKISKRIKMIVFAFASFLIINILRIFLLSLMYYSSSPFSEAVHKLFWYIGSVLFVVGIWFTEVKIFKLKQVPVYSDLKFLYSNSSLRKQLNKSKRTKQN